MELTTLRYDALSQTERDMIELRYDDTCPTPSASANVHIVIPVSVPVTSNPLSQTRRLSNGTSDTSDSLIGIMKGILSGICQLIVAEMESTPELGDAIKSRMSSPYNAMSAYSDYVTIQNHLDLRFAAYYNTAREMHRRAIERADKSYTSNCISVRWINSHATSDVISPTASSNTASTLYHNIQDFLTRSDELCRQYITAFFKYDESDGKNLHQILTLLRTSRRSVVERFRRYCVGMIERVPNACIHQDTALHVGPSINAFVDLMVQNDEPAHENDTTNMRMVALATQPATSRIQQDSNHTGVAIHVLAEAATQLPTYEHIISLYYMTHSCVEYQSNLGLSIRQDHSYTSSKSQAVFNRGSIVLRVSRARWYQMVACARIITRRFIEMSAKVQHAMAQAAPNAAQLQHANSTNTSLWGRLNSDDADIRTRDTDIYSALALVSAADDRAASLLMHIAHRSFDTESAPMPVKGVNTLLDSLFDRLAELRVRLQVIFDVPVADVAAYYSTLMVELRTKYGITLDGYTVSAAVENKVADIENGNAVHQQREEASHLENQNFNALMSRVKRFHENIRDTTTFLYETTHAQWNVLNTVLETINNWALYSYILEITSNDKDARLFDVKIDAEPYADEIDNCIHIQELRSFPELWRLIIAIFSSDIIRLDESASVYDPFKQMTKVASACMCIQHALHVAKSAKQYDYPPSIWYDTLIHNNITNTAWMVDETSHVNTQRDIDGYRVSCVLTSAAHRSKTPL